MRFGSSLVVLLLPAALVAQDPAPLPPSVPAQAIPADSAARLAYLRARRLVNDGQGAEGRAIVDSMLNAAEPRSPAEAEALYWRAMLAESWDTAQRDYLRIMLEHERSSRAGDAMLRLAQGEVARGDRDAAVRYLERLAREAPESPARAEAGLWHGRILVERGEGSAGCGVLREARTRVPAGAIELENQYDYLLQACPAPGAVVGAAPPTPPSVSPPAAQPPAVPSNPGAPSPPSAPVTQRPPTTTATPPVATGRWTVQVAALSTRSEANALVDRLKAKGYEARVDGTAAPFRVRFGRFPSMAAAAQAMNAYKAAERADAFVVEMPPG